MNYKSEDELKRALAIDSWRNLSKEKMIRFAAMMPDMDKEVALKVIEQFPVFKTFALAALDVMEKRHDSTLVHNEHSQESSHRAYQETRAALKGELDRTDLTPEERQHIYGLLMETAYRESEKDSENKQFLDGLFKKAAVVTVAAVSLGVVFVGGKVMLQGGDGDEKRDQP